MHRKIPDAEQLQRYFDRGVKRVIVAAPVKDEAALNIVVGVNDALYDPRRHRLLTAASCTTNCLAPVVKVVHEAIGIRHGQITTIHDMTNTNVVIDAPHKDLRRARSAMLSMHPTTTGSATAIALIYPELKGKLNGHAVRVPILNSSLTDCVFELKRPTTVNEVNALFEAAAAGPLAGILGLERRPLVSADYNNDSRSSIVDALTTMITDETLLKVYAWYDNEVGYACRMVDLANIVLEQECNAMATNYLIVTASYWGFTLVDGALRMLVLFHFYQLGYTPFTLAFLFLLYETAGIVANLGGGWLASRFGIPRMLAVRANIADRGAGDAVGARSGLGRSRVHYLGRYCTGYRRRRQGYHEDRFEVGDQGDFRRGQQSVVPLGGMVHRIEECDEGHWLLRRRTAARACRIPGSAVADGRIFGFHSGRGPAAAPGQLGKAKSSKSMRELFSKSRGVNLLAAARIFMFGARDVWFVVGLPVFLYANGWHFMQVAGFLAAWTIAYGGIQAIAPSLVTRSPDGLSREIPAARLWAALNAAVPVVLIMIMQVPGIAHSELILVTGLALFGVPFAVNSSLHSYLILAYAGSEKAAEDVGFYYAANAAGRLLGIILSGLLYQVAGISACLIGSAVMLVICWLVTFMLPVAAATPVARHQTA